MRKEFTVKAPPTALAHGHLDANAHGIPRGINRHLLQHLGLCLCRKFDADISVADTQNAADPLADVGGRRLPGDDERVRRDTGKDAPAMLGAMSLFLDSADPKEVEELFGCASSR
jgi:hypothetical protein